MRAALLPAEERERRSGARVRAARAPEAAAVAGPHAEALRLQRAVGNAQTQRALVQRSPGGPGRCACGGLVGAGGECGSCRAKRLAREAGAAPAGVQRAEDRERPGAAAGTVPRPAGLPLDGAFQLLPARLPAHVAASMPEGEVVTLPEGGDAWTEAFQVGRTSYEGGGGGYAAVRGGVNAHLSTQGFAAAGDTAVGLVAVPRMQMNPLARNFNFWDPAAPLDAWGHTAMYVRQGGRVTVVRGFNPQMGTPAQFLKVVFGGEGIVRGTDRIASAVSSDAYLFTSTAARTMEWPVSPQAAVRLVEGLPEVGPVLPGSGHAPFYTASPAQWAAANPGHGPVGCVGSNCGLWATQQIEPVLGGRIGQTGQLPVMDIEAGGVEMPGVARQGKLMGFMEAAEDAARAGHPSPVAPVAEAGEAVAGSMPRYVKYVKWGGRVFMVIGIATVPAEVYFAPEGQKTRTAVGAGAGFLGGAVAGAAAGLVCGPGAPVCSVVLGIGFGVAGGLASRSLAEGLYDIYDTGPLGGVPLSPRQLRALEGRSPVCPTCHPVPDAHDWTPPAASGRGPAGAFTPADAALLREWLQGQGAR
ncbi:MAG: hypothetical protein AB1941_26015 [Gemmatimonadota bacterium]